MIKVKAKRKRTSCDGLTEFPCTFTKGQSEALITECVCFIPSLYGVGFEFSKFPIAT